MTRIGDVLLVPVIEIPDADLAVPLAEALIAGGLPCAEITFRTPETAAAIEAIVRRHPNVLVGAGTVRSKEQVDRALGAGASFLVSPGFSPTVVEYALEKGATMLPGVCTPTELEMALSRGIETVKFFPAEPAGGARYLKALTAPYPSVRFVPTGGIDAGNLGTYLAVREVIAVGGSWMAPRDAIGDRKFAEIARRTREAVDLAHSLRSLPASSA